jgi:predicted transcriptional regulator
MSMIEQLKKRFEDLGYTMTFMSFSDHMVLGIEKGYDSTQFILEKKGTNNVTHTLYMVGKNVRDLKEEVVLSIIDVFEQEILEKKGVMKIDASLIFEFTEIHVVKSLRSKGYDFLDKEAGEVLEEIKGEVYEEKRFMISPKCEKRLNQKIAHEMEMKYYLEKRKEESWLFDFHAFDEGYWFVEEGNEGYITLSKEEETKLIWYNQEKTTQCVVQIHDKKEIETMMDSYLENLVKKNRVKKVLEPSDFFYKKFIYSDQMYADLTDNTEKKLYEELLMHFRSKEMEELCSQYVRSENLKKRYLPHRCVLFFFGEKVVVIDQNKEKVMIFDKDDEYKHRVNRYVMKRVEDELNEALKDI